MIPFKKIFNGLAKLANILHQSERTNICSDAIGYCAWVKGYWEKDILHECMLCRACIQSIYAMCKLKLIITFVRSIQYRAQTTLKLFYKPQLISTDRIKVIKEKISLQTVTQSNDFKCIISNRENEWQSPSVWLSPHRSTHTKITFTKCSDAHERFCFPLSVIEYNSKKKNTDSLVAPHTQKKIFSLVVSLDYHDDDATFTLAPCTTYEYIYYV